VAGHVPQVRDRAAAVGKRGVSREGCPTNHRHVLRQGGEGLMAATTTASRVEAIAKEYEVENRVYGVVSAKAMGLIEAAQKKCGNGDPLTLLRTAAMAATGDNEVLMDLYTYGRFEFDLRPLELGKFYRERVSYPGGSAPRIREICVNAAHYWSRVSSKDRGTN